MIESVKFENFKVLRDAVLPLSRLTLLVGPNGSGKSTAIQGLRGASTPEKWSHQQVISAALRNSADPPAVRISAMWQSSSERQKVSIAEWKAGAPRGSRMERGLTPLDSKKLSSLRFFAFEASRVASTVQLSPSAEMESDGANLVVVMDRLRDRNPERFEALNMELRAWMPEFDRILFETPHPGMRSFQLRARVGHHTIDAADLSQGTVFALAVLTLAYIAAPPAILCLEEPDRGIHPRLLRDIKDALYRLAYPESCGEKRDPVQVVATTHSPYLLDLFRDHPEEVVICEKLIEEREREHNIRFTRLSDRSDLDQILQDAHLGDAWYSGVLGGVPDNR
ncbi:MAG: AAA family ATPase [Planctomycetaceae bacterium]|nr:AAA family ATPase [Planctomycetaceae bacterium]